jgi:anti-sigma regulatory factor (Ser/Thr protein kinase)
VASATSVGSDAQTPSLLSNRVYLELPAQPELFFLARMTAAAVGSCADLGYDKTDDLRLAVDETLLILLEGRDPDARIHLEFEWTEDAIEVTATVSGEPALGHPALEGDPTDAHAPWLSERILDALVDYHSTEQVDGATISTLRVCRQTTKS